MKIPFDELSDLELLQAHNAIIDELKSRGVVRSKNQPIADYAEGLACRKLNLKLVDTKNNPGYDAIGVDSQRYQIKSRQPTPENTSTQTSFIYKLDSKRFDFIIGILFNEDYSVKLALKIPYDVVKKYAKYKKTNNAHVIFLQGELLKEVDVFDITHLFK